MIRLNILELLQERGRDACWLQQEMHMHHKGFDRLIHNETRSIRYETLQKLCDILCCTPNELFVIEEDKADK